MNYNTVRKNRLTDKLRNYFRKQQRQHDPMLVLNMAIFNFESGWSRLLNPVKHHE